MPFQQRGTPVAIPIVSSGITADFPETVANDASWTVSSPGSLFESIQVPVSSELKNTLFANHLKLGDFSAADVSELRFMFQVQKFMERSARAGNRYTEFLRANFGVSPRDERLQRPEFIGGTRSPILIQQVLQTSQTSGETTPMATKYGQGMTADSNYSGKYYATEYGIYMPLFVIKRPYFRNINQFIFIITN